VFGPGGLGTGINNSLGGLKGGAGAVDAHGVGGLGSRGTGSGGGGTGLGSISLGGAEVHVDGKSVNGSPSSNVASGKESIVVTGSRTRRSDPAEPAQGAGTDAKPEKPADRLGGHHVGALAMNDSPSSTTQPATGEDPFETVFGGGAPKSTAEDGWRGPKQRDVYIPGAPGSGGDIADQLSMGDVMEYIRNQKPAIVACVKRQRALFPDLSGTLVMRWTILANGKTSDISVQTAELKDSYLADCMMKLINQWVFPRHKSPRDPINFPFKF
jgi:hypothetical protein